MRLIHSVKWEGDKDYKREKVLLDKYEKRIYCILYNDESNKTIVSSFSLSDYKEKVELLIPEAYMSAINYSENVGDYFVSGIWFYQGHHLFGRVGEYKGMWLNTKTDFLFTKANQWDNMLEKVEVMADGDILYYAQGCCNAIYDLKKSKSIVKKIETAAFSESGEYFSYIKRYGKKYRLYVFSYTDQKKIDEIEIARFDFIHTLKFCNDDKFICLKFINDMYLFEINR